jgi:hypothetical protein
LKPTTVNAICAENARLFAKDMPFSLIEKDEYGHYILTVVIYVLNVLEHVLIML